MGFKEELKELVQKVLSEGNSNFRRKVLFKKFLFISLIAATGWCLLVLFDKNIAIFTSIVLLAVSNVLFAFNFSHEHLHCPIWKNKIGSLFCVFPFVMAGIDPQIWVHLHNINHHSNTNIVDHDTDISNKNVHLIRFHKWQKTTEINKHQKYYLLFIYSVVTLWWMLIKDPTYLYKNLNKFRQSNVSLVIFKFIVYKLIHLFIFLFIPILILQSWKLGLLIFFGIHIVQSLCLALTLQIAHLNLKTVIFNDLKKVEKLSWAAKQLHTSANFAINSKFSNFILGGLNFQIEHHILPGISHVYYPLISSQVEILALKYGYPYHKFKNQRKAIKSHIDYMDSLY